MRIPSHIGMYVNEIADKAEKNRSFTFTPVYKYSHPKIIGSLTIKLGYKVITNVNFLRGQSSWKTVAFLGKAY